MMMNSLIESLPVAPPFALVRVSATPLQTGFDDAFGVLPVIWATVFFLFLVHMVRTKWMAAFIAIIYVAIQVMLLISLVYGGLDRVLIEPTVSSGIRIFWFVAGALLVGVGSVYARDWQVLRKDPQAKLWIGFPDSPDGKAKSSDMFIVKLFAQFFFMLIAVILGVASTVTCSVVLQDYDIFIKVLGTSQMQGDKEALNHVLTYIGAYLTPSYVAALLAVVFLLWGGLRTIIRDRLVVITMTLAIVFTALGAGAIITVM